MRNKFIGGPNDGEVHMTFDLLTDDKTRESIPWDRYSADVETEVMVDGIEMRTWRYQDEDVTVPSAVPDPAPGQSTTPRATGLEKSQLRVRREALKLGRQEVADAAGITIGVMARLETKGGTDDEVALVENALTELEGRTTQPAPEADDYTPEQNAANFSPVIEPVATE